MLTHCTTTKKSNPPFIYELYDKTDPNWYSKNNGWSDYFTTTCASLQQCAFYTWRSNDGEYYYYYPWSDTTILQIQVNGTIKIKPNTGQWDINLYVGCEDTHGVIYYSNILYIRVYDYCKDYIYQFTSFTYINKDRYAQSSGIANKYQLNFNPLSYFKTNASPNLLPGEPWHNSTTCQFSQCTWLQTTLGNCEINTPSTNPITLSYDEATQTFNYDLDTSTLFSNQQCLRCTWKNSDLFVYSQWFYFSVTSTSCGPTSVTTSSAASLQTNQVWEIDNIHPYFLFEESIFTGNPDCGCSYQHLAPQATPLKFPNDMKSTILPASFQQSASDGKYYIYINTGRNTIEQTYSFYLLTYCSGGYEKWANDPGTKLLTLQVKCGLNSGSITQTTNYYSSSLSDVQIVPKSSTSTTKFVLPQFTDAGYCTITTYQVSQTNIDPVSNPGSSFVSDPTTFTSNSNFKQVVPHNIAIDGIYSFYVKVTQRGGKTFFSSLMTLKVGCQPSDIIWTDTTNSPKTIEAGSSASKAYTFSPPTVNQNYCEFSHSVVNVLNNITTPLNQGIIKSLDCTVPDCLYLDLESTTLIQTIQFRIETCTTSSTFVNVCTTSPIITITVSCGINSGSITQTTNYYSSLLSDIQIVPKNSATETMFVLPKFTDAGYCTITTYQVSQTNIDPVSNPGNSFVSDPTDFTSNSNFKQVVPHNFAIEGTYKFYIKVTQDGGRKFFSSLMTLVVGCQTIGTTWADVTNNDLEILVGTSSSKVFKFNPPTITSLYCMIGSYTPINVINDKITPLNIGIQQSATCLTQLCLDFDLETTSLFQTIKFQIKTCTVTGSVCHTSPTIKIIVKCIYSLSFVTDALDLQTNQAWEINNTQPYFGFSEFTFQSPYCGCQYFSKKTQSASDSQVTNIVPNILPSYAQNSAANGKYKVFVSSSKQNIEANYTFYLLTQCDGGYNHWAQNTSTLSTMMTFQLYCGVNSGSILQTNIYYQSLSDVQKVDINDARSLGTKFILPKFLDAGYCTITTYESSYDNKSVNRSIINFVKNPSAFTQDSSFQQVVPQNITADATYTFYVKVTQTGGKFLFSSLMTLIVGCQPQGVIWTDATNKDKTLIAGSSNSKVYTFSPPTITNSFCTIGSFKIFNINQTSIFVQKSATCNSLTCLDIDLNDTNSIDSASFFIETCTKTGNLCHNSSKITIITAYNPIAKLYRVSSLPLSFEYPSLFKNFILIDKIPTLKLKYDISSDSLGIVNIPLKQRYAVSPSTGYPINEYLIYQVLDLAIGSPVSLEVLENILKLDSEQGILSIQSFTQVFDYQIFFTVSNGKQTFVDPDYFLQLTFIQSQVNNRQKLQQGTSTVFEKLNITLGSTDNLNIIISQTIDNIINSQSISFSNLPNYVSFNSDTKQLTFNQAKFTKKNFQDLKGNLILQGSITDSKNVAKSFTYNIQLIQTLNQDNIDFFDEFSLETTNNQSYKPIDLKIIKHDQSGLVTVEFSEDLISLTERNDSRLNLTSISNEKFLIIQYTTFYTGINDDDELMPSSKIVVLPKLEGWQFEEFTNKQFKIRLNYSNPLLVSQSDIGKDNLVFTFMMPQLFQSKKTMKILEENYTLTHEVPTQMNSKAEFEQKQDTVSTGNNGLLATMLIPIFFQVFFSFAMDILWSMIAAMQLVSNIKNLAKLGLPAQVTLLMGVIDQTVNFNIMAIPQIQSFMKSAFGKLSEFIEVQGELFVLGIGFLLLVIILGLGNLILNKMNKQNPQFLTDLKAKLMWGTILRPIHQGYFRQILKTFETIQQFQGDNYSQLAVPVMKLLIFASFPIIVTYYLYTKKNHLQNPEFMKKFGVLYSNLRVYYSRDFPAYNPDNIIDPNQSNYEKSEENKEMNEEIDKEGGIRDRAKFDREIEMIMNNDFSFANEEQKKEEKKDLSLKEEDVARMQMVKDMHGPIPDNLIEGKLIKKYPQLLHPLMYMTIRLIVAILTVFAQDYTSIQIVIGYIVMALLQAIYLIHTRPLYDQKVLGRLEVFNSIYLLITSYFLILFTDFVIDPIIRSQIGEIYYWLSIAIIAINVLITLFVLLRSPYIYIQARYIRWQEKRAKLVFQKEQQEKTKIILAQREKVQKNEDQNDQGNENKSQTTRSLKKMRGKEQNLKLLQVANNKKVIPLELSFGQEQDFNIEQQQDQNFLNTLEILQNVQGQQSPTFKTQQDNFQIPNSTDQNIDLYINQTFLAGQIKQKEQNFQQILDKQRLFSLTKDLKILDQKDKLRELQKKTDQMISDLLSNKNIQIIDQNEPKVNPILIFDNNDNNQDFSLQNELSFRQTNFSDDNELNQNNFTPDKSEQKPQFSKKIVKFDEEKKLTELDIQDYQQVKETKRKIEKMNSQNEQEDKIEQLRLAIRQKIEEFDFIKPAYKEQIYQGYFRPTVMIDFLRIRQNYLRKNNHENLLLTDFEAKKCLKTFKLMFPQSEVKDFCELMDFLHFKEKEQQTQEMAEYAEFCSQEKSYQVKNDKKREVQFRSEVRKIETLQQIGFPIEKIIAK